MENILLKNILKTNNIDLFLQLNPVWFTEHKATVKHLQKYLTDYSKLPNLEELPLVIPTSVDNILKAKDLNISNYIIKQLKDNYIKSSIYDELYDIIDEDDDLRDTTQLIENLSEVVLKFGEEINTTEEIVNVNSYDVDAEDIPPRESLGLGKYDEVNGGLAAGELCILGGYRGTGKSFLALNTMIHSFEEHHQTVAFISIEMPAREVYGRLISMISDVPLLNISKKLLTDEHKLRILDAKAKFFKSGDLDSFLTIDNIAEKEKAYNKLPDKKEKFFIIDSPGATLGKINYYANKLKSQYNLKYLIVDYLNIIKDSSTSDNLDWKLQIAKANELKSIARSLDLKILAPFQTDSEGKIKYAKGIEDPVDISLIFKKSDKKTNILLLSTSKVRNGVVLSFPLRYNAQTLRIMKDVESNTQST